MKSFIAIILVACSMTALASESRLSKEIESLRKSGEISESEYNQLRNMEKHNSGDQRKLTQIEIERNQRILIDELTCDQDLAPGEDDVVEELQENAQEVFTFQN